MAQVVNPQARIVISGDTDITIEKDDNGKALYLDFIIEKDFEEEPNYCNLNIWGLNPAVRAQIASAANQSAPIEVFLTPSGSEDFVGAFRGEIVYARNRKGNPNYLTYIHAESQKLAHQSIYFEKNYAKGTPIRQIVDDMIKAIGLPSRVVDSASGEVVVIDGKTFTLGGGIPETEILMAESFSGKAFPLLRRYCYDLGLYCYIIDGVLIISSVYNAPNTAVTKIEPRELLSEPEETTREDEELVEQKTVIEVTRLDPLAKIRPRKKRKVKIPLGDGDSVNVTLLPDEDGGGEFAEYETVDVQINGYELEVLMKPGILPDDIVKVNEEEIKDKILRVYRHVMEGNTEDFSEWTSYIGVDAYEESEYGVDSILGQTPGGGPV